MAHSIETHLNAIKAAADRASGTMRPQASAKCNREAYRALLADMFASFEALAYELDGDGAYISDERIGITSENGCVDSVFLDLVEGPQVDIYDARVFGTDEKHDIRRDNVAMFKPRAGLNAELVKGASFL
jgi:hypothetical protein